MTAYNIAARTVFGLVEAADAWEENALEQAKNSLMFELVNREANVEQAVTAAVVSSLTGSREEAKELLMAIDNLGQEEVKSVAGMVANLFNASLSRSSLVCDALMLRGKVVEGFANLGLPINMLDPRVFL